MMAKRPEDRHPDAASLVAEITDILDELEGRSKTKTMSMSTSTRTQSRMRMNTTTRSLRVKKSKNAKYANSYSGLSIASIVCFVLAGVFYFLAASAT